MHHSFSDYHTSAQADAPDIRDRMYEPRLLSFKRKIDPPKTLTILDQGAEGACTGFGLAAVINRLYQRRKQTTQVSARMLYEMAKRYDEWVGQDYAGSSCRGAIKGWKNMGVCTEKSWPYEAAQVGYVTLKRAKEARAQSLGAYYRLRPEVVDFHSALNEVGIIFASASVHEGWKTPKADKIPFEKTSIGGHAFAIVGYNNKGFWIQNSWGKAWGKDGVALWSYEDWAENISDAWVVQLGISTPQIFDYTVVGNLDQLSERGKETFLKSTARSEICGHFVHLDDGNYHDKGRYWSNAGDVAVTAELLRTSTKYDHLLFYAHGGLNSPNDAANRIAAMKSIHKDNRIYPYHFMYDTGIMEEIKDVLLGKKTELQSKMGGFTDWWDRRVENLTRKPGRALWREMKRGASKPFESAQSDGTDAIKQLLLAVINNPHPIKIHVIGHSTGGILLAYLLERLYQEHTLRDLKIDSCCLLAPAATVTLYNSHFAPLLKNQSIDKMRIYNLSDKLEEDDNVILIYRKSLLNLVSHAFEESDEIPGNIPLLGLERCCDSIVTEGLPLEFIYSQGKTHSHACTQSETHGGFDNDAATMNDVMKYMLGTDPTRKFTQQDLDF